jgi:1,6-anhydro-N-acetylmuramate kinase
MPRQQRLRCPLLRSNPECTADARLTLGPHACLRYPSDLRHTLLHLPGNGINVERAEREVTELQSRAVRALCADSNIDLSSVNVVGFHGQTIRHDPQNGKTWQLLDGQQMADTLGCLVVNNFRQNDLDNGGQGAPFAPAYHQALVRACAIHEPTVWELSPPDGAATLTAFTAAAIATEAHGRRAQPHPAPLLLAATRLSVAPEDCTYIGDAERDVLAARAAGMKVFVAMFGYIGVDERPMEWPATGWLDTPRALCSFAGRPANE